MNDDRIYIEQMIAGSFVKYNRLSQLIQYSFAGSDCSEINLFIDLNSILKPMYSVDSWTYKYRNRYEIAATIINMCGHYREFFRAIGVATNIYLIYGLNCPSVNDSYVSGYNSKFIESYIKKPDTTELISENLMILNLICQYLPKIYFFNIGNCEVSSMVDYLINNTNAKARGFENIVISKDILMLQLIPEHDIRIIRPTKTKDGDVSYIVDNSNLWPMFIQNYRKIKDPVVQISNSFISNVMCMTRVPERGLFAAMSIPNVFKIINIGVNQGFLDPTKIYSQSTMNTVLSAMDIVFNPIEFEMRYRSINTHYQSTYVIPIEKPEFKRLRLVDLEDIASLKEIIAKYFMDIPIDIDRL